MSCHAHSPSFAGGHELPGPPLANAGAGCPWRHAKRALLRSRAGKATAKQNTMASERFRPTGGPEGAMGSARGAPRGGRRSHQVLVLLMAVACAPLVMHSALSARAENTEPSDRSSRSMAKSSSGKSRSRQASVEEKLERILKNQQAILEKNNAIKEEVRVIQVRALSCAAVQ